MKTSSYIIIAGIAVFIVSSGIFIFGNKAPESKDLTASLTLDELDQLKSSILPQVNISPDSVATGGNITLTVSTEKDIPSFWLMDIYLEGPSTEDTIRSSISNINGDGKRFGNITIPIDASEGIWKVKKIEIINPTGNIDSYNYQKETSTTFTITK